MLQTPHLISLLSFPRQRYYKCIMDTLQRLLVAREAPAQSTGLPTQPGPPPAPDPNALTAQGAEQYVSGPLWRHSRVLDYFFEIVLPCILCGSFSQYSTQALGPVPRSPISLIPDKIEIFCQCICEYETDSPQKHLHCEIENQTNDPGLSSLCSLLDHKSRLRLSLIRD